MKECVKSRKGTANLKQFLDYIKQRQEYLKRLAGEDYPLTEIKYYKEFSKRIADWGKKHKIFYTYIYGKINVQEGIELMGVSERMWFRIIAKQKSEFVCFLKETEKELDKIYEFIPFTDEFITEMLDESLKR